MRKKRLREVKHSPKATQLVINRATISSSDSKIQAIYPYPDLSSQAGLPPRLKAGAREALGHLLAGAVSDTAHILCGHVSASPGAKRVPWVSCAALYPPSTSLHL